MRKTALILAAAATVLAGGTALQARERLTGEERLAKMLEGRVAGRPVSCISTMNTRDSQVIDKTAIVYDSGSTIYVNRPRYPQALDSDDILVTELHGGQLCRLDTVRLHDRTDGWYHGFVGLEDFVPYRRVAKAD
ncbi:MAG: hypothetical protein KGL44_07710 [Sphingomonadales bacterium]|nr:hypothetical protein [Sphingomonadales bacterium]